MGVIIWGCVDNILLSLRNLHWSLVIWHILDFSCGLWPEFYFVLRPVLSCGMSCVAACLVLRPVLCCGLWSVVCGLWSVVCGLWPLVCGLWSAVCGLWSYSPVPGDQFLVHTPSIPYPKIQFLSYCVNQYLTMTIVTFNLRYTNDDH